MQISGENAENTRILQGLTSDEMSPQSAPTTLESLWKLEQFEEYSASQGLLQLQIVPCQLCAVLCTEGDNMQDL